MFTTKAKLELSKTVKTDKLDKKGKPIKERKKVGEALVPVPALSDFGLTAEQAKDEKGQPQVDDDTGLPVYADPKMDWLYSAITGAVFAKVRNYFKDGVLQPGKILPTDFDTLTAETARTGEALKLRREARASFEAFLATKGKKAEVVQALGELFYNSAKVLGSASPKYVEALAMHVNGWLDTLSEESKTRFTPKISELLESMSAAQDEEELDLS